MGLASTLVPKLVLPPGMPAMMSMPYGMEIMQDADKITIFSEHQDALRRIFLDGRKPSAQVLADPTYAGYSTGRWIGDTLVVETTHTRGGPMFNDHKPNSTAAKCPATVLRWKPCPAWGARRPTWC